MKWHQFLAGLPLASAVPRIDESLQQRDANSLIVKQAPQHARPYVLRKGDGQAVVVGSQVYRFSVTGNSSAGAFTLMQTNSESSTALGVLPHIHKAHYENFYCTKGRIQLWAQTNSTGHQGRLLTAGDYGAVPHNTIHTFQVLDPDTQITGVIQPGGFEELFIAISNDEFSSSTGSEFVPGASDDSSAGSDADTISALEGFDVYAQLDFVPRRDFVNGTAGGSANWHNGSNSLASDPTSPNFIAKNYGPKYLNNLGGGYQLVAPLTSDKQTAGNFSMGTATLSPILANMTAPSLDLSQPVAFQMEEGSLEVKVSGHDAVTLIQGDVIFVPAKTRFAFHATASFTKFLYVSGGSNGFSEELLSGAQDWNSTTYPISFGY
ncbi:hypothetical protein G7Z17_g986 [Cylindrodendrum hubeiense]|uniref:Quercetin 2,3-dioxygenase n=1 Tax=Cylindrodendrum hubeiense TaxID=595255 RepID=A0A9P5HJ42_9HYPO|nr:hypothetical protein G7Z17_g986 [Cylindrodendrum hubeiense]